MIQPNKLSKCCHAPLKVDGADEGTCCYICTKCNKPSDPLEQSSIPKTGLLKDVEDCKILNDRQHYQPSTPETDGLEDSICLSEESINEIQERDRVYAHARSPELRLDDAVAEKEMWIYNAKELQKQWNNFAEKERSELLTQNQKLSTVIVTAKDLIRSLPCSCHEATEFVCPRCQFLKYQS